MMSLEELKELEKEIVSGYQKQLNQLNKEYLAYVKQIKWQHNQLKSNLCRIYSNKINILRSRFGNNEINMKPNPINIKKERKNNDNIKIEKSINQNDNNRSVYQCNKTASNCNESKKLEIKCENILDLKKEWNNNNNNSIKNEEKYKGDFKFPSLKFEKLNELVSCHCILPQTENRENRENRGNKKSENEISNTMNDENIKFERGSMEMEMEMSKINNINTKMKKEIKNEINNITDINYNSQIDWNMLKFTNNSMIDNNNNNNNDNSRATLAGMTTMLTMTTETIETTHDNNNNNYNNNNNNNDNNGKFYYCDLCPEKKFTSKSGLRYHENKIHLKKYQCDYDETCTKCFGSITALKKHKMKHKPFKCDECELKFDSKMKYEKHFNLKHSTIDRKYKCPICEKKFNTMNKYTNHCKTHSVGRPFRCIFCDKRFRHQWKYIDHQTSCVAIASL